MKCWNCEEEGHGAWDCPKDLKQSVRIRMKEAQQRKLEREEKERGSSSESGKKYFIYGLVNKTYIEKPTTTSPLQFQDFVNTLMVIDTRRVDGNDRKSLDTGQCQKRCINTLSQRLYSLLSENLTEKVILNLTDCDSLSNHITTKTTDEKVISLTKSALSNQHDVLSAAEHAPAYGDEFGTWSQIFYGRRSSHPHISAMQRVLTTPFSANNLQSSITFDKVGLVICIILVSVVHLLLQLGNFLSGKSRGKCTKTQYM
jgi:hypothetical protein